MGCIVLIHIPDFLAVGSSPDCHRKSSQRINSGWLPMTGIAKTMQLFHNWDPYVNSGHDLMWFCLIRLHGLGKLNWWTQYYAYYYNDVEVSRQFGNEDGYRQSGSATVEKATTSTVFWKIGLMESACSFAPISIHCFCFYFLPFWY